MELFGLEKTFQGIMELLKTAGKNPKIFLLSLSLLERQILG